MTLLVAANEVQSPPPAQEFVNLPRICDSLPPKTRLIIVCDNPEKPKSTC